MTASHTRKTALITGATGGIGQATARELARRGYRVLFTARDAAKGQRVLEELRALGGGTTPELFIGDLSSMGDVRRLALEVRERHGRLDVLINNAGGLFSERRETVDGLEHTLALNHLSPFLLTNLLLPSLVGAGPARVVNVSSAASRLGTVRWNDLQLTTGYAGFPAYNQSKLLNVLFSNALARRLRGAGATSNSLHPGVVKTGFGEGTTGINRLLSQGFYLFSVTPEQGAQTSVYLACSPEVEGVTGQYFVRQRPARANPMARDEVAQERLWALSEGLVSEWQDQSAAPI